MDSFFRRLEADSSLRTQRKEGTVEGANLIKLGAEKGRKRGEERERGERGKHTGGEFTP